MKGIVLLILALLSFSAYASTPITADEGVACVTGKAQPRTEGTHSVVFSNGFEADVLRPGWLASMAVLKTSETYSATFKVDGVTTQTINFSFKGFPETNACFNYDAARKVWVFSRTERDMCYACSIKNSGKP